MVSKLVMVLLKNDFKTVLEALPLLASRWNWNLTARNTVWNSDLADPVLHSPLHQSNMHTYRSTPNKFQNLLTRKEQYPQQDAVLPNDIIIDIFKGALVLDQKNQNQAEKRHAWTALSKWAGCNNLLPTLSEFTTPD